MDANDQIWRVAIPFVKSTNVVKLPNPHNSIHNALRSESQRPERRKLLEAQKLEEWADSRSDCTEVSSRQFGHSLYRLLDIFYLSISAPIVRQFVGNLVRF